MANDTKYGYLISPAPQFLDTNGKPISGGKLKVYIAGTTTKATTYSDWNLTKNTWPIVLDSMGTCQVIVSSANLYKFVLESAEGEEPLITRDNVAVAYANVDITGIGSEVVNSDGSVDVTATTDPDTGMVTYDLSIQKEIDRAEEAEGALAEDIADETDRAKTAEKAAKTEIVAGDNITVTKTVGADGQDVYTIEGENGGVEGVYGVYSRIGGAWSKTSGDADITALAEGNYHYTLIVGYSVGTPSNVIAEIESNAGTQTHKAQVDCSYAHSGWVEFSGDFYGTVLNPTLVFPTGISLYPAAYLFVHSTAQNALGSIKDWTTSITSFRTGDVIPVDGPNGTAKMSKDTLLAITADNVYSSLGNEVIDDNSNIVKSGDYVRYVLDSVGTFSEGYGIVADPDSILYYGKKIKSITCNAYEDIRCDAFDMIAVNLLFPVTSPFSLGLVFYDSDGTALPGALLKKHMTWPDMKSGIVVIDVPSNAYKFSISVKNTDTLYCVGLVKKNKPVSFYPNKAVVSDSNNTLFGLFLTSSISKSSKPMLCDGYTKVLVSNILPANSDNARGICFFDKTMTPIAGYYGRNASTTTTNTQVFDIPQNAVFFAFTINQADNTYELKLINDSGLDEFVLGEKLSTTSFNSASSYEQGALDVYTGNPDSTSSPMYPKKIRTDFIVVPGGSFIYVSASSKYSLQVLEYDTTKTYTKYSSGAFNSYHKLRGDTAFIRLAVNKIERKIGNPTSMIDVSPSDYSDIDASLDVYAFAVSNGIKKAYTSGKIRFKVLVNQNPIPDCDYSGVFAQTTDNARKNALYALATSGLEDVEILQTSTGVLALPTNYTKNGTKTKLILFAHGGHGYVDDTHWYPTSSVFNATLDRLLGAGYAVFDCNGYKDTSWAEIQQIWNDGNVQISEGLPQVCEAYYKCYKYIIENYNIDPRIYIWGCSQGGHLAMNFGYCHRDIVAAIAMMAGQIDLYDQGYAYQTLENKRQVAKLLGFADITFANNTEAMTAYEHYRADKWDPMQRLVTIDGKKYIFGWNIPIKFFYGTADTTLPQIKYTINLVEALQNSKVICYLRMYDGYDHDDVAVGKSGIATREALEWFNRF